MSSIGSNPAQALAGIGNAERAASKEIEREKSDKARVRLRRRADEVELSGGAEAGEAVRKLKDPTEEEARRDEDAKERYGPSAPKGGSKRLDVSG